MASGKKVVFLLVLLLLSLSVFNLYYILYVKNPAISGKATQGIVSFELKEQPKVVNYNVFWLPAKDATIISGIPMAINVSVTHANGTGIPNATVKLTEKNGWSPFAVTQYWPANPPYSDGLTSYQAAQARTQADGTINFTVVTTGGDSGNENLIGNYELKLEVYVDGQLINYSYLTNTNRGLPSTNGTLYDVPNENWAKEVRDKMLVIYNRIKGWNGGESKTIILYSDNTNNGTVLNATSGKPLGIYFIVQNASTHNPIDNATIVITEQNGWSSFATTQYWPSNPPYQGGVSNSQVAEVQTDALGIVNVTIVPTGGDSGNENLIGYYNITLNVTVEGVNVYSKPLSIGNRGLPSSGTGQTVPNYNWIGETRDKILVIYNRIKGWI